MLCYYGGRLRLHLLAIVVVDRRLDTNAPLGQMIICRWRPRRRARPGCIISAFLSRVKRVSPYRNTVSTIVDNCYPIYLFFCFLLRVSRVSFFSFSYFYLFIIFLYSDRNLTYNGDSIFSLLSLKYLYVKLVEFSCREYISSVLINIR